MQRPARTRLGECGCPAREERAHVGRRWGMGGPRAGRLEAPMPPPGLRGGSGLCLRVRARADFGERLGRMCGARARVRPLRRRLAAPARCRVTTQVLAARERGRSPTGRRGCARVALLSGRRGVRRARCAHLPCRAAAPRRRAAGAHTGTAASRRPARRLSPLASRRGRAGARVKTQTSARIFEICIFQG